MRESLIYKLDYNGKSYRFVMAVHRAILKMAKDFRAVSQKFSKIEIEKELAQQISKLDRDIIDNSGLSFPVIEVIENIQSYPRAYQLFPKVYVNGTEFRYSRDNYPKNEAELYMDCPVGYNGKYFIPSDARLIDDEKEKLYISNLLFGAYSSSPSFFSPVKRGVALPDDYICCDNNDMQQIYDGHYWKCYLALGDSLEMVKDYKRRMDTYSKAINELVTELRRIIDEEINEQFISQIEVGNGYYMNFSASQNNGEKNITISVRKDDKINFMNNGQVLEIKNNDFFIVGEEKAGEYRINPNRNTKSGRELAKYFDNVILRPCLSDYPELMANMKFTPRMFDRKLGINGQIPLLRELEGNFVFIYNTDNLEYSEYTPPDSIEIPAHICRWLIADEEDIELGIIPPPQPEGLKNDVIDLFRKMDNSQKLFVDGKIRYTPKLLR